MYILDGLGPVASADQVPGHLDLEWVVAENPCQWGRRLEVVEGVACRGGVPRGC